MRSLSSFARALSRLAAPALVLVLALSLSFSAAAQDEAAPEGFDHAIDDAVAEFAAGHWAEARALFLQAHALLPNARTLRGIGMAAFEMRDYPAAARALGQALEHPTRPLTDEQRTQVAELLARARALVGRFVVPASPPGSRLYVDGEGVDMPAAWPEGEGELLLGVGEHRVTIRAEDGATAGARVIVSGTEDCTLDIDMAPLFPTAADPDPDPGPDPGPVPEPEPQIVPPDPPSSYARSEDPGPWILIGVGAGVAVLGAVVFGVGVADVSTVESAPIGTPFPELRGAYERAPILTSVGGVALGAGALTALVGVVWGLTRGGGDAPAFEASIGLGTFSLRGTL